MGPGSRGEIMAVASANPQNSESNATFPAGNGYEQLKKTAMKPGIRVMVMAMSGKCPCVWAGSGGCQGCVGRPV
jgi:hypothetical protein